MNHKYTYLENNNKDAAFHFSVEEYIVEHYPFNEPVFMIWQADNCVMLGKNQVVMAEVDIDYAKQAGINIVRRSSGGGTIFTDLGTLLFTMILPDEGADHSPSATYNVDMAKNLVALSIADALNKLGIPAKIEGRNDILVENKKISGLAQYVRHGRICTHGSLLYDTDLEKLTRVLTVDESKISSKALQSVRSRVTNIKEHMRSQCSTAEFCDMLKEQLFSTMQVSKRELTDHDLIQINEIYRERYSNPTWTFQQSPKFTYHNSKRFSGGKVEVYFDIEKGFITSCSIKGDFLGVYPIRELEERFEGKLFERKEIEEAVFEVSTKPYLGSITKEEFLSCVRVTGFEP